MMKSVSQRVHLLTACPSLEKGLRKLDHPLKNADELLAEVMKAVDTDKDGRIQYSGQSL